LVLGLAAQKTGLIVRNGIAAPFADERAATPQPCSGDRMPVLNVEGLSKSFGPRSVLERVSFTLSEHEFVAVLGPSGAGKTTLFRCITGMTAADTGRIQFEGVEIESLALRERRKIAVVFQEFNLVRRLTALENVLAGRLAHVPMWRGVLRCFDRVDILKGFESLERVGLLDQEPRLIVADEPVASLDPSSAAGVLELLKQIARSDGVAVICSLHQVNYARLYADRIVGLSRGRVILDAQTGTLDDAKYHALYEAAALPQDTTASVNAS
jgi:phosphonate transport system ATP-binding protein